MSLENRILACENENVRLRKLIRRQNLAWLVVVLLGAGSAIAAGSMEQANFGAIKASEVSIVDAKGIVRARLGGDLPDAVMADGRVSNRGSKAAGLLIYDEQGIERGGYVTQDTGSNAMLTLDSKYRQAVLLVAAPEKTQASALKLWTEDSAIELRSDSIGSRISANDKHAVIFQKPEIATLPSSVCARMKELEQQYPDEHVCRSRYTDTACSACLQVK